jgi:hypothetical protein
MSMVNIDSYIVSRRIKFLYQIINETFESWNAIGKYWLSRLDLKFNETFFTDVQSFKISPNFWPVKFFIIKIIPLILTFW